MKKIISFLLSLAMILGTISFAEEWHAEEAEFSNSEMNMRSDLKGKFSNDENGAVKTGGGEGSFIEGTITVEIEGTYRIDADMLISGNGGNIQLSVNGKDVGGRVATAASGNSEKTVNFGNAYMNKGENVVRFTAKSGRGYNIGIKKLKIGKESVKIDASSAKTGNCFVEGDEVSFDVDFKNVTSKPIEAELSTEAESSFGTIYKNKNETISLSPNGTISKKIGLEIKEKNTYTFRVRLKIESEKEDICYELPFSYVERTEDYDGEGIFGTCTHISGLKTGSERLESMKNMLKNSGIMYIRDEYYWDGVELEKGKYTFQCDDYVDALNEIGIKPMICLSYSNKFYGVPHNEEGYEAFGNYAAAVAEHLKGKVYGFEIWNEWNGGTWNGGYGNEEYVNIIKATYPKLKAVDADVPVAIGAAITAPYGWFDNLFKLGAFDYCDVISYHPYCMPSNPDQKTYRGNIEDNFENMYKTMEKYGTPKKQWITEWGWYTGTAGANVDEKTQAEYLTRGYINGLVYGIDKIFMYDFKNDGIDEANSEHNYGTIRSWDDAETVKYASKPSYVAVAAVSNKLNGAKFIKEYRPLPDARVYLFEKDEKDMAVMYYMGENSTNEKSVRLSVKGDAAQMQAYDIFGNAVDIPDTLDSSVIYLVGEKGRINIDDIELKKRKSALITFGQYKNSDGIYAEEHYDFDSKDNQNCFTVGKDCKFNEISCNIDEGYIFGGINPIAVEISYFDNGTAQFCMEYAAPGGAKRTEPIKLTNTGKWKTAKIYIDDAAFDNSLDGNDFKLVLTEPEKNSVSFMGIRIVKAEDEEKRVMSVSFDNDEVLSEISTSKNPWYSLKGDGCYGHFCDTRNRFEYLEKGGRKCVYLSAEGEALYIYVDANDDILYGNFSPVKVSIDYFDEGHGTFTLGYDVGNYTLFKEAEIIKLNDTKEWKTAEYILVDCWWKNYCNNLSDLRVALWATTMGRSPEGISFGKVTLEVMDGVGEKETKMAEFSDTNGHWAESYLTDMAKIGAISGYSDGTMKPDNNIKVNEFVALVMQKMKYGGIKGGGTWDSGYINRAEELGIVADGEFDSFERNITRAEIARIVSRISGRTGKNESALPSDFDSVREDLKPYVAGVFDSGIMIGDDDGCFYPERNATRAEAAVIFSKI